VGVDEIMFICPSCTYENDESDVVCMGCGYPIGNEDPFSMRPRHEVVIEPYDEDNEIATGEVYDEFGEIDPDVYP
jgi:hypothetical protein